MLNAGGKGEHAERRSLWPFWLSSRKQRRLRLMRETLRQLARLTANGDPLAEGLAVFAEEAPGRALRRLASQLARDIGAGAALHEALARRPDLFPPYVLAPIRTAEACGCLTETLAELRGSLQESAAFQAHLSAHAGYLWAEGLWLAILTAGLCEFVLPQYAQIFGAFHAPLPTTTRVLVAIGRDARLQDAGLAAVALGTAFLAMPRLTRRMLRGGRFGVAFSRMAVRLPGIGFILVRRDWALAAAVLEKLLAADVPVNEALAMMNDLGLLACHAAAVDDVRRRLERGESWEDALRANACDIPPAFRGLAVLGRQSGALPDTLRYVARLYRREALSRSRVVVDVAAPMVICCFGALVFVVYHGLFVALSWLPGIANAAP